MGKDETFTVEEIKGLAVEILPLLDKLAEFKAEKKITGNLPVFVWDDGHVSVNDLSGWTISKYGERVVLKYNYEEAFVLEGGNE